MTEPHEWRFVKGKQNPADCANRSQLGKVAVSELWLHGPEFLYQEEGT